MESDRQSSVEVEAYTTKFNPNKKTTTKTMDKGAETLAQRISGLLVDLETCQQEIVDHVTALYGGSENILTPVNLKNDPRNAMKMLQHEVLDCTETVQERGGNYRERFASDMERCRDLMESIVQISTASEKIVRCDEVVGGVDLKLANKLIAEVKQSMAVFPLSCADASRGTVIKTLRREARLLSSRFQAKLRRLLGNCIVCECGRLSVTKRLKGMLRGCGEDMILETGIDLADIWEGLVSISSVEDSIAGVIESVWQAVLKPLWKERRPQAPRSYAGDEQAEMVFENIVRDHSLSTGTSSSSGSHLGVCRMPLPQLLEQVGQVLTFVALEVFGSNPEVIRMAAVRLSEGPTPLMAVLVETLCGLVPKSESELGAFQRSVEKPCKDFENKLTILGFLYSAADGSTSSTTTTTPAQGIPRAPARLSDTVSELRTRFADMRRTEILGRGRDLLLSDYHNTMVATGDASEDDPASAGNVGDPTAMLEHSGTISLKTLHFESCQVSLAACRVLKLVHEVMKQACQTGTSPALAAMLYQSARDCLELFLAIVPVRFADVIDTVPRMGAVLYNDCCYMAHNCTLITHTYKEDLGKIDPALQDNSGFIDFIPRFRTLGERCLNRHLDEQRAALADLVARVNITPASERSKQQGTSSAGLPAPVAAKTVRAAAGTAVGEESSHREADEAAPPAAVSAAVSVSVPENDEASAALVVRRLERLRGQWQGVLQDEVYERVVGYLLEGALRALTHPVMTAERITESAGGDICRLYRVLQRARNSFATGAANDDNMNKAVASWVKFCVLTDLLEYSLSEVAEWLKRRKFVSFTGNEMSTVIRALYADSARRQEVLKSILEMTTS